MPTIACLDFGCKKAEKYIRNQVGNFDSIKFFICSKVFTLINFCCTCQQLSNIFSLF